MRRLVRVGPGRQRLADLSHVAGRDRVVELPALRCLLASRRLRPGRLEPLDDGVVVLVFRQVEGGAAPGVASLDISPRLDQRRHQSRPVAGVLDRQEQPETAEQRGLLTVRLRSDGRHKSKLYVDGGPSSTGTVGHLRMEGREVFRHAVAMITDVVEDAFKATGYTANDIDWFIPHQANKRIIDGSAHKLGIPPGKIVVTVDRHGNTSAASIPLALADAVADRRIKRGDLLLLEAMGGGFTWGAALIRW